MTSSFDLPIIQSLWRALWEETLGAGLAPEMRFILCGVLSDLECIRRQPPEQQTYLITDYTRHVFGWTVVDATKKVGEQRMTKDEPLDHDAQLAQLRTQAHEASLEAHFEAWYRTYTTDETQWPAYWPLLDEILHHCCKAAFDAGVHHGAGQEGR